MEYNIERFYEGSESRDEQNCLSNVGNAFEARRLLEIMQKVQKIFYLNVELRKVGIFLENHDKFEMLKRK